MSGYGAPTVDVAALSQISGSTLEDLAQWLEQRGLRTPVSQLVGFTQFSARTATVSQEAHTTSATYADPNVSGGAGPTLTGLPQGSYVVFFGGSGGGNLAVNTIGYMGVSVNGSTPANDDFSCEYQQTGHASVSRIVLASLTTAGNTNTLKALYRSSDGTDRCDIRYRWITAVRYLGT